MADLSKIKLPSGTTYNIKDNNALPLTGGSVTGPVSFGDSVSIDDATIGSLVVDGGASFTNNINANTINSAVVGNSPKFTDEKVKLTSVTNDSEYPVLLGPTSITSGSAYSGDYTIGITINPNSKQLTLKSINLYYNDNCSVTLATKGYVGSSTNHIPIVNFASTAANTSGTLDYYTYLSGVETPTSNTSNYDTFVANKKYVDDKFGSIPITTQSKVTGITASTTATKTTLGTAFTIPNVTSAGSASTWAFEEVSIPNVTAAGNASTWAFEDIACDDITSWSAGSGSASISGAVDSSDSSQLNITISHTHTAPTLQYTARTVSSKKSGANSTAPTLGTTIKVQSKKSGANGSAPTLGTAFTVPNVTGNTSATVSVTDPGHTHSI